jgi:hypothetical protein
MLAMRYLLSITALLLASSSLLGRTPGKSASEPDVINIEDVSREFVHVEIREDTKGAHLSFVFEKKSKREVYAFLARNAGRPVRIKDGPDLIAKCRAVGTSEWRSKERRMRYGLILAFDSIEDAERTARAIRPLGK